MKKYELILSWNNPKDRMWIPVGRLSYKEDMYSFSYTYGAQNCNDFKPFGKMDDLTKTYLSEELFPLFKNRLLQKSRPEYSQYLDWLNVKEDAMHPMEELSLTGGVRATDSLQLFPIPTVSEDGYYRVKFFSHGMRYLASHYLERAKLLREEETLYLMKDIQNPYDKDALVLRTGNPPEFVGYCPKNYVQDFNYLINANGTENVNVKVLKNNKYAPSQLKLLCEFKTKWVEDFTPFSHESFQPIEVI